MSGLTGKTSAPPPLKLEIITSDSEFDKLGTEWASLLARGYCDRLFNSWPWQRAWWQVWSAKLDLQLHIVAIYCTDGSGQLVGLLPICFSPRDSAYAFLGALPRSTFRSELLDAIVDEAFENAVVERLATHLSTLLGSANFHAVDVPEHSSLNRILKRLPVSGRVLLLGEIPRAEDTVYEVNCEKGFRNYVSGLGKNSRLKLFNRRAYLQEHYPDTEVLEIELTSHTVDGLPSVSFLSFQPAFDRFHQQRWNKPFLGKDGLDFQARFVDLCKTWNGLVADEPAVSIRPVIAILQHQKEPISLLYDIIVGDTRYNMQMGFAEDFDKKLSLGTLHLGYAIESACEAGTKRYSFLAGTGRLAESSYKTHLATTTSQLRTSCSAANQRLLLGMCRDLAQCAVAPFRR